MPQDELWRASARLTGYRVSYQFDVLNDDLDQLTLKPQWSCTPQSTGPCSITTGVPTYMRWSVPMVLKVAHEELLGGLPRNLPGVVRRELRGLQEGFSEGRLH